MFKKTVHDRGELFKVIDALDALKKDYTIVKATGAPDGLELDKFGIPKPPKPDEWHITEVEPQEDKAKSSVGDLQVKLDIDTSSLKEALKDIERLSDELAGLEGQGGVEDKLTYLDRLIGIASISSWCGGRTGMDVTGRVAIVCNSIQDDLGLKIASQD